MNFCRCIVCSRLNTRAANKRLEPMRFTPSVLSYACCRTAQAQRWP
jgi:hypothetical protein